MASRKEDQVDKRPSHQRDRHTPANRNANGGGIGNELSGVNDSRNQPTNASITRQTQTAVNDRRNLSSNPRTTTTRGEAKRFGEDLLEGLPPQKLPRTDPLTPFPFDIPIHNLKATKIELAFRQSLSEETQVMQMLVADCMGTTPANCELLRRWRRVSGSTGLWLMSANENQGTRPDRCPYRRDQSLAERSGSDCFLEEVGCISLNCPIETDHDGSLSAKTVVRAGLSFRSIVTTIAETANSPPPAMELLLEAAKRESDYIHIYISKCSFEP
jgi:hypothetical protein